MDAMDEIMYAVGGLTSALDMEMNKALFEDKPKYFEGSYQKNKTKLASERMQREQFDRTGDAHLSQNNSESASVAIGYYSKPGLDSIAIGSSSKSVGVNSIAIGYVSNQNQMDAEREQTTFESNTNAEKNRTIENRNPSLVSKLLSFFTRKPNERSPDGFLKNPPHRHMTKDYKQIKQN